MLFLYQVPSDSLSNPTNNLNPVNIIQQADGWFEKIGDMALQYAPKLFFGLSVLYFGFKVVNKSVGVLNKTLRKSNFDEDLRPFATGILGLFLKFMLVLTAAEIMGIETASFVALLAATGFAVGLAFQGSLSNFAGGILILFFKPFRTGDLIRAEGYEGQVKEIQLLYTILETLSHRRVVVPNSLLSNGVVENITGAGVIRLELTFSMSYSGDIDHAREVIMRVIKGCPYAIEREGRFHEVLVNEWGASSVDLIAWVWVNGEDFWNASFFLKEYVKKAFDKEGLQIPFPQLDVHMIGNK